jgi:hypothetical protein
MNSTSSSSRTLAFFVLVLALSLGAVAQTAPQPPTVVFMTDFGLVDDSVALCRGVMYSIVPNLRIVDLTHQVTLFSILDGARFLYGASPYFAPGTVFVAVVDPGVGSIRKAVVIKTKRGQYFVLPDNGLITLVADRDGLDAAREITNRDWMVGSRLSSTFHGRDIFSPVGAHVASGEDWTKVGPEIPLAQLIRLEVKAASVDDMGLHGEVIATDGPFGNLVTNVDADLFDQLGYKLGESITFRIGEHKITAPFVRTFSDVPIGGPLLYIDSRGHLGFSVNQRSAADTYKIKPPARLTIPAKAK